MPNFICLCRKGSSGDRCEIMDHTIVLTFAAEIELPEIALMHFIRVFDQKLPENGSTFEPLSVASKSLTVRWTRPFHNAFLELFRHMYYLVAVQKTHHASMIINRTVHPSDRCSSIGDPVNETIVHLPLIRRGAPSNVPCFYDTDHFCLCNDFGDERVANCFEFNTTMQNDCFGQTG